MFSISGLWMSGYLPILRSLKTETSRETIPCVNREHVQEAALETGERRGIQDRAEGGEGGSCLAEAKGEAERGMVTLNWKEVCYELG